MPESEFEKSVDVSRLDPREKPKVNEWLAEMRTSFDDCSDLDFFTRMTINREYRYAIWNGQNWKGTKSLRPDQHPDDIFPWPGASDARVHVLDEVILENVGFKMTAAKRAQTKIIPRNLSLDRDLQQEAASWSLVSSYYEDVAGDAMKVEQKRWFDIAEEFGHSVLYTGWLEEKQMEKRSIAIGDMIAIAQSAQLHVANVRAIEFMAEQGQEPPVNEDGQPFALSEEEVAGIMQAAETEMENMAEDPDLRDAMIGELMAVDSDMSRHEARHVATRIKAGAPVEYYAPYVARSEPEWRALVPWVNVFYPPHTTDLKKARWVAMTEWVDKVTLRNRVASDGYNQAWVDKVLENPGRSLDLSEYDNDFGWLIGGGSVGTGISFDTEGVPYGGGSGEGDEEQNRNLFQIVHLYYRATTQDGVPALYCDVLHGMVEGEAGKHECQPDAHGEYPFVALMREPEAPYLAASRGVPEISFTDQKQIKTQRDLRDDHASISIKPPLLVPWALSGGRQDVRPGRQLPRKMTAGAGGGLEWMKPPGDAKGSVEVEQAAQNGLNSRWWRGKEVEPAVALMMRQCMVDDCFLYLRQAKLRTFQLVQQYAPDEIKGIVAGRVISVSRSELQGQAGIDMVFDIGDLDFELVGKKIQLLVEGLRPLDSEGLLPVQELLYAATSALLPNLAPQLANADPASKQIEEREEEAQALNSILNGQEPPYVPGKNHRLRLSYLQEAVQSARVQRILQEDDQDGGEVLAILENRIQFHTFQVQQQSENPNIGRLGVKPVKGGDPANPQPQQR